MIRDPGQELAGEFMAQLETLFEKVSLGQGVRVLSLAELERLDLEPLLAAQEALDRANVALADLLSPPELVMLLHRIDILTRCLGPFGREDGPLASRLRALSGQGPQGAYAKASRVSTALFGQKTLGQV
jgi:hypothetical protein